MKVSGTAWRAQKGNKVRYAKDRVSGTAIVMTVLEPTGKPGNRVYNFRIRDIKTDVFLDVTDSEFEIMPSKKKIKRKERAASYPFVSCFED